MDEKTVQKRVNFKMCFSTKENTQILKKRFSIVFFAMKTLSDTCFIRGFHQGLFLIRFRINITGQTKTFENDHFLYIGSPNV